MTVVGSIIDILLKTLTQKFNNQPIKNVVSVASCELQKQ